MTWPHDAQLARDLMPHVGEAHGVYYVQGPGGHGIALGVWLGRSAAQRLSGLPTENPFERLVHRPLPGWAPTGAFLSPPTGYYQLKHAGARALGGWRSG